MLRTRLKLALQVRKKLTAVEASLDNTIALASEMQINMLHGRQDANISATVGQEAFDKLAQFLNQAVQVRGSLVDTHNVLSKVEEDMGIDVTAGGDFWKVPNSASEAIEHDGDNIFSIERIGTER